MRATDRENEGELFKGRDPVARAPHRLLIDRLIWVESEDGLELPHCTAPMASPLITPSPSITPLIQAANFK